MKHGRYSQAALLHRVRARETRQRLRQLSLLARYGFASPEAFLQAVQAGWGEQAGVPATPG